jgi:hypothetical protein
MVFIFQIATGVFIAQLARALFAGALEEMQLKRPRRFYPDGCERRPDDPGSFGRILATARINY